MRRALALTLACSIPAFAACGRKETQSPPAPPPAIQEPAPAPPAPMPAPFRVSSVLVGNAIDADKRVVGAAAAFAPMDTVYASVATEGESASVTLKARWTYEDGQLVNEESQTIAPTGPATSEFHISKPDGLPAGRYRVEIMANDAPAGGAEFSVQ
jgi:hypothetical protein